MDAEFIKSENKLLTRGDGKYGRDISIILPHINIMRNKNISDIKETLYIRGELVISRKNFEKYKSFAILYAMKFWIIIICLTTICNFWMN